MYYSRLVNQDNTRRDICQTAIHSDLLFHEVYQTVTFVNDTNKNIYAELINVQSNLSA